MLTQFERPLLNYILLVKILNEVSSKDTIYVIDIVEMLDSLHFEQL